ncbi:amidohydrolase family protein [Mangrovimonas spongiae]|uniref:Amidohydrolase n=1 Tax=Mangrovimonas spongiae TaxID=2494697 RepID=A0A3R9NQ34_9FLAO|nr:amidohydrolase family protein [Mangrovimonas spongiae]RSK39060.1 amidohydrolase [Mangrovimonas spongiae]
MKLLKKLLKATFFIISCLILIIVTIILIDGQKTSYLNTNKLPEKNTFIIKNANIIPMKTDTVLTNKMIYIKEGIINTISHKIDTTNITVINAQGKYLTPGLIDMHVHIWDKYELGLYLANGVTAVRNLWGMPMHLRLKEDINNNKIVTPIIFTSSPKLTGPEFIGDDNLNLTTPEQAKEKVISYKKKGYDFIKTYYGLTENIFDAIIDEAKINNIDIVAHPSQKVAYSYHFNPQIKSIEHTEDIVQQPLNYTLDTLMLKKVVTSFSKSKHSAFSPTLVVYNNIYQMLINDTILNSEQMSFMNPLIKMVDGKAQFSRWHNAKLEDKMIVNRIKDQHDFHLKIIKQLHEAGVPIICSTDAGIGITLPGYSIHKELSFYKEAGLSNYDVLKTATVNAAQTHKIMNNMGTIEVGKVANLLLVDANPLSNLSTMQTPKTVFIKGKKLEETHLDYFKQKAKNRKNLIASAFRYIENLMIEK